MRLRTRPPLLTYLLLDNKRRGSNKAKKILERQQYSKQEEPNPRGCLATPLLFIIYCNYSLELESVP